MIREKSTIAQQDVIIKDPLLEPYFIVKNKIGGYTVYKTVQGSKKSREYTRILCYPSSFKGALKRIADDIILDRGKNYETVRDFLSAWEEIYSRFNTLVTI